MLKVLIVDDDSVAITNIKVMIEWEENGFEICGEAANGEEAIQKIKQTDPQIVITDISMPVMDGTALIDYLNINYPQIKIIALSGYQDYDYVRKSMLKGAVDYILKHTLGAQSLLEVLRTAKTKLLDELSEHAKKRMMEDQIKKSRTLLVQKFINQLVHGEISEIGEIKQQIADLNLDICDKNLAIVLFEIDDYNKISESSSPKEMHKLIASVQNICSEILKEYVKGAVSHVQNGKFVIVFSFGAIRSNLFINNTIVTTINRVKSSIKRYLNITACFSYSRPFADISEIHEYYKEAEAILQGRFFKGKDKIIDELSHSNEYLNLDLDEERTIIDALRTKNNEKIEEYLDRIFTKFVTNKISYNSIQMICAELINIANRVAREIGIDIKRIYNDKDIPYSSINKFETLVEMKTWILNLYKNLICLIDETKFNPNYSEYTRKAICYIQNNYKSDVSLNEVAEYLGVNSSYLSRLFKEDCGIGFVEYLNQIRVGHAKQIIENRELKLKDVAKEVGFNNYTYFFKVFKDVLNVTPVEFKRIYR